MADRWFLKHGEAAVLISRLLPVVRTFISLPAGIARMNVTKFVLFTFIGAVPWCYFLAYIGLVMGERWNQLRTYFHHMDLIIGAAVVVAAGYFLWSHWPKQRASSD
jgi:membrane protein DedA with SNARE-associated domain